ncbi:hypothetical protein [Clostridium estertheticum]|nr:hypothetical protein [Clostridium estertheticum]
MTRRNGILEVRLHTQRGPFQFGWAGQTAYGNAWSDIGRDPENEVMIITGKPKVFYTYQNKKLNLKSLYSTLKKKRGKAKIKASVIVEIGVDSQATPIKSKIVFVKNQNKAKSWLAILKNS